MTVEIIAGATIHLRVTDNGAGIPVHARARIFEPFFSTKEGNIGMGMSIVHSFVAMHDGDIEMTSGPSGTMIDVALPAQSLNPRVVSGARR